VATSGILNVGEEPLDTLLQSDVKRGKLEVSDQLDQLCIGCWLAVLAIVIGFVLKCGFSRVLERAGNRIRDLPDANFIILVNREDDGFDTIVFAQLPDEEFREIARVEIDAGVTHHP